MEFNQDFRDMLVALNEANVKYLVVGAYAVAAHGYPRIPTDTHGYPRATGDLDLWIQATAESASGVMQALRVFGAPTHEIDEADFAVPSIVFQIGVPPGRIDLLTSVSGLEFESAWLNRVQLNIDDVSFYVVGLKDLIQNKRASGRPKDLADIAGLVAENK